MKKTLTSILFFVIISLQSFSQYDTTHVSIASYDVPDWYSEGKLGIFMHLSAFSVPAFQNEWYPRHIYYAEDNPTVIHHEWTKTFRDHHIATYGSLNEFGYKDFIPMFKMEKFDADYYADLVKKSGASYFASPAVHHDGFAMWDSDVIDWNAMDMGPKRDVVGELTEAMRQEGIKTGVSTHYGRHWKYYPFREEFDTWDTTNVGLYGKRRADTAPPRPEDAMKWENVMNELVDNYQPDYIFVDGGVCDALAEHKLNYYQNAMYRVVARYYNKSVEWDKNVVLSWKRDAMEKGEAVYDTEGSLEMGIPERPWQAHFTVNGKWAYMGERPAKPLSAILRCFVDLVSRNGNLLLNIGPRPDGTLDENQEKVLLDLGKWMEANGEGISGSKPWEIWGAGKLNTLADGKDFNDYEQDAVRYTMKDSVLYAWFVSWPGNGKVTLPQAGIFNPKSIVPLGGEHGALKFEKEGDNLIVDVSNKSFGNAVWGLKLSTELANMAPTIEMAFNDTIVNLNEPTINLNALVADDGLPAQSQLTYSWEVSKGVADNVSFTNENQKNTDVTFIEEGYFELKLSVSDGEFTSTNKVVVTVQKTVGVNDILQSGLRLYPNPAYDSIILENTKLKGPVNVVLYNEKGNAVLSKTIITKKKQNCTISIDKLTPGIYIVTLKDKSGNSFSSKVIIK